MKKNFLQVVCVGLVVLMAGVVAVGCSGCFVDGSTYGIPHGSYYPLDENGEIIVVAPEGRWQIRKNQAKRGYRNYQIIEEEGLVFFDYSGNDFVDAFRYEVKYNNETGVLTVFMPSGGELGRGFKKKP
jgi:hypothetical protein